MHRHPNELVLSYFRHIFGGKESELMNSFKILWRFKFMCLGTILFGFLILFVTDVSAQDFVDICDRTPEVEAKILEQIGDPNTTCENVTSDQLSDIDELILNNLSIGSLVADDFAGLDGVTDIRLVNNNLTELPSGLFDNLINLEILYLEDNSIGELDKDIFDDLNELRILVLDRNQITELPEDLFEGTPKLVRFEFWKNRLDGTLESDLFNGLRYLRHLELQENSIEKLPEDLFVDLSSLKHIDFYDNDLTAIPADLFDYIPRSGVHIDFGGNNISCLPPKILNRIQAGDHFLATGGPYAPCEDPDPEVTLHLSEDMISEDGGMSKVTASLSEMSTAETKIVITVKPESPTDYSLSSNVTLTIAAEETESMGEVVISAVQNVVYSRDRTFQVEGAATNTEGVTGPESVTLTIRDDEIAPILTFAVTPNQVSEDDGRSEITITASWDIERDRATEVDVAVGSGSAMVGEDFEEVDSFTLTIPASETMGTGMFTLIPIPDDLNESDETISVTGSTDLVEAEPATLTLTNADPPPQVTLALSPSSIMENSGVPSMVTAQLSAASNAVTTIDVSVAPDSPDDYTQRGTMLTIAAGETMSKGEVTITAVDNEVYTGNKTFQVQGMATNLRSGAKDPDDVVLTIEEDEPFPTATLAIIPNEITEGVERMVTVTATLDVAFGATKRSGHVLAGMTVSAEDGTASVVDDLEYTAKMIMAWEANELVEERTYTFFVAKQDGIDEPPETIRLVGTGIYDVTGRTLTAIPTEFTIVDADDPPVVTLNLTASEIWENGETTRLTANQTPASSEPTTIEITMIPDSPATDDDYTLTNDEQTQPKTMLTIPAGSRTSSDGIIIEAVDNEDYEGDKTVTVRGTPMNDLVSDLSLFGFADVGLTILDDDVPPRVTLEVDPPEVNENGESQPITVTARLNAAQSTDTQLTIMVEAGTAEAGTDYTATPSSFPLTIAAGAMEETAEFAFEPLPDDLHEGPETVQVIGAAGDLEVDAASLTILDVTEMPQVELKLMPEEISEKNEMTTVTARLSAPSSGVTTIEIGANPIPSATTMDYEFGGNQTLMIPAGATESTGLVTIMGVDNEVDAPNKKVQVTGMATNPIGITGPVPESLTITDDEASTGFTLEVVPSQVNEGAGYGEFTVTATLDVIRSTSTPVTLTVGGGTATEGEDYTIVSPPALLTIEAKQPSSTAIFALMLVDDFAYDPQETILITGTSAILGGRETVTYLTIVDNEEEVFLAIQDTTVQEDVEMAMVEVTLTSPAPPGLSVRVQTFDQTATELEDYRTPSSLLLISEGATNAFIPVEILDDESFEENETFRVQLSDPIGAELERGEATVTIEDDDRYELRVGDASALESESPLTFMVTLDRANPEQIVRVAYATQDGSALAGEDYMHSSGTLTFPKGVDRLPVSVRLNDDDIEEMEERFFLKLSAPENAVLVDAEGTGTIVDDDALPIIDIQESVTVREEEGQAQFRVTLSHALPGRDTQVDFLVIGETASAPLDYQVKTQSPLRFISGETTKYIDVQIIDDEIREEEETFRIQLIGKKNGVLGQSETQGIILDNEEPVTVTIRDVEVSESEPAAVFLLVLSGQDSKPRTFTYMTEDESAISGQDYEAVTGEITFEPGELKQEIRVPIMDDLETEPTETFWVRLSGDGISDGDALGRIQDNDMPLTVSIYDQTGSEGDGSLLLPVRLNRTSSELVTVRYTSLNETALAGSDYITSQGIVIFERGSKEGKIRIEVLDDTEEESNETFQVTLSNARHATIAQGTGTGTILDDDGSPTVSVQSVTVSRHTASFEVGLSIPSAVPVLVSYMSEDGSALAGEDYEAVAGQVTFAPSELSKTVNVKLLTNEPVWEAKTFSLVLLSAVNAEVEQARSEAVMEKESEESIQNAYVSRVLRTWASQVVEALTRRMEGMTHCRIPDLSWLRYGRERWSPGEIFRGCGAEFTQGGWSVWGQGAYSRMRGQDGALSLSSDVTTMLLGADYAWDQGWMAGLVAAQSWDQGTYETPARAGTASSRLTGFYPYVSYQTGAGMRAWMLLGLGRGESELEALETELDAALVALGLTGTLTGSTTGRLGYEVDAFWATADMETGADLGIRRVRAGVEGSLRLGASMEPYLETALRQDGGDAETGLGMELGGGLRWATRQLRAEVGGRTLVLHTDEGLREWELMGSIEYGTPGGLGPSMRVRPLWGNVYGGDLWREAPLHSIGVGSADQRVEMELGYGAPIQKSVGQSIVGMTVDPSGRAYRVGYNLRMRQGLQVSVSTTARTIEENGPPPSYGLSARMDLKW